MTTTLTPTRFDIKTWRRNLEQLLTTASVLQFEIGDTWLQGLEHLRDTQPDLLLTLAKQHPQIASYARVSRAFPKTGHIAHRLTEASWLHHDKCSRIQDEHERMAWLEDSLRQAWTPEQLALEIGDYYQTRHPKPPALNMRATGDLYTLISQAAALDHMNPKDWLTTEIEIAAKRRIERAQLKP